MVSDSVILDWIKNEKRIRDRLNRVRKRIKKYSKQEKHYEFRLEQIKKFLAR